MVKGKIRNKIYQKINNLDFEINELLESSIWNISENLNSN